MFLEKLPRLLACGEEIVKVAAGEYHVLALSRTGAVYGLGCGEFGQFAMPSLCLGVLTRLELHAPMMSVFAAGLSSFFQPADGGVWACGNNGFGELGLGMEGVCYGPQLIQLTDIVDVQGGTQHTLFL